MLTVLLTLASNQSPPADDDVVAGGWGAIVLVGLIVAVVLLGFSLAKQLRKVREADEAGVYGREDQATTDEPAPPAGLDEQAGQDAGRDADHRADEQRP